MKTWVAISGLSEHGYDEKLRNVEKHVTDMSMFSQV